MKAARIGWSLVMLCALLLVTLACKKSSGGGAAADEAKPYVSQKHKFTVTFPAGSKEVLVRPSESMGEDDVTYMTVNNDGIYRVRVFKWARTREAGESMKTWATGAGVTSLLDDTPKETTFQGLPALEDYGWKLSDQPGADGYPVKQFGRLIAVQKDGLVYELTMRSDKQEKLKTSAADGFFSSFKFGAS